MKLCLTVLGLRYLTYQGSNFRRQGLRPARPCLAGDAELGFDLLFEPLTGLQGGKTADLRLLVAILLYPEGEEKHKEFKDLPYKMDFHLKRDEILKTVPPPERTWAIGKGKVPVTYPHPNHDRWSIHLPFDSYNLSVHYRKDLSIKHIIIDTKDAK